MSGLKNLLRSHTLSNHPVKLSCQTAQLNGPVKYDRAKHSQTAQSNGPIIYDRAKSPVPIYLSIYQLADEWVEEFVEVEEDRESSRSSGVRNGVPGVVGVAGLHDTLAALTVVVVVVVVVLLLVVVVDGTSDQDSSEYTEQLLR